MEEFEFLVNACLKSKIKGYFVMRNGDEIPGDAIEPYEDPAGLYAYHYESQNRHMFFTSKGTLFTKSESEFDIVDFIRGEYKPRMVSNREIRKEIFLAMQEIDSIGKQLAAARKHLRELLEKVA
jgi:hypothetical protein